MFQEKKMHSIDCSIIVPAYNAAKTILRTCDSIKLAGTWKHSVEVLVVNDGSIDNTQDIVENYIKDYPQVKLFNKKNEGVSSARNLGLQFAQGKYVFFVDSDDEIIRETLEHMIDTADKYNCDMVIARYCTNVDYENKSNNASAVLLNREDICENILRKFFTGSAWGMSTTCNKLYNRQFLNHNNIMFDNLRTYGEDWAFNLDCFDKLQSCCMLDDIIYVYYQNGTQGEYSKYSKGFGYSIINGLKRMIQLNNKYNFYDLNSLEYKKLITRFILQFISYMELDNVSKVEKKRFLDNPTVKQALSFLSKLNSKNMPGWTFRNHLAIWLLKLKQYKLLIVLHYRFNMKLIPNA